MAGALHPRVARGRAVRAGGHAARRNEYEILVSNRMTG